MGSCFFGVVTYRQIRLLSWPCVRFLFSVLRCLRFFAKFAIFAKIVKIDSFLGDLPSTAFQSYAIFVFFRKNCNSFGGLSFSCFSEFCDFCVFSQKLQLSQKSQHFLGSCFLLLYRVLRFLRFFSRKFQFSHLRANLDISRERTHPASFWREKRDADVILVQGFAKMSSNQNKSTTR